MKIRCFPFVSIAVLAIFTATARGENPFLRAKNPEPVSAPFRGTEWGDEIESESLPLHAKVVTTRLAQLPWGAVFRIAFTDVGSKAKVKREIPPLLLLATDDKIVRFNEDDADAAVARLAALAGPPAFDPEDIVSISKGKLAETKDALRTTTVAVNGDLCTYSWAHDSGHSTTYVWQKGVGLVAHSSNRGARSDGYSLKRVTPAQKSKR